MFGKRLRSGKILAIERSDRQRHNYSKKKALKPSESNMAAAELLEELKSMTLDLTGQITKLSDDLKDFQRNTNESADGKAILQGVRIVEDFTPSDFNARKKALPLMKQAYHEGKKVRFTRGKLFIDGREIYVA